LKAPERSAYNQSLPTLRFCAQNIGSCGRDSQPADNAVISVIAEERSPIEDPCTAYHARFGRRNLGP
jgi:hypothetical protein